MRAVYGAVALLTFASGTASAESVRWNARRLYESSVTEGVRLTADGSAVELDEGELVEDDGPAAGFTYGPNEERLSATTWAKKELLIADPRTRRATLLVGPGGAMKAVVNGKAVELTGATKAGGYWEAYALPPDVLMAGVNEIVLHGGGRLWVARVEDFAAGSRERSRHPNRSARSTDGGKTWDHDRLGTKGDLDGEYYVRLFLDRFRARGTLILPVMDAGNLAGRTVAPPLAELGPVRVSVRAEGGDSASLALSVRFGPTPIAGARGWSTWRDLGSEIGTIDKPEGRYLQVRVTLATRDPLRTPRLREVTVRADPKPAEDWTKDVKVAEWHNEEIIRSSVPFEYEPFDHPRLKQLREQHRLDDRTRGARGETELITRLAAWSSQCWERGHLKEGYPTWDALEILKPHADGKPVGGFCQQYNVVFLQACESFGIPGRAVSIATGDGARKVPGGGHEVVELWSNEHGKWIHVDGNMAWYFVEKGGKVPLSLWELRARQLEELNGKPSRPVEVVKVADAGREWKGLSGWPPFLELRLIPRSNFLERKHPLPLNQGMRGWFWTGHHAWTDAESPASLLYGNRERKRTNFEWTLNQAHLTLEATATPGEIRVHVDTETPGFATFLARIDGADPKPVESGFVWKLHQGENRLEVWPRNKVGREGIASRVVLRFGKAD